MIGEVRPHLPQSVRRLALGLGVLATLAGMPKDTAPSVHGQEPTTVTSTTVPPTRDAGPSRTPRASATKEIGYEDHFAFLPLVEVPKPKIPPTILWPPTIPTGQTVTPTPPTPHLPPWETPTTVPPTRNNGWTPTPRDTATKEIK